MTAAVPDPVATFDAVLIARAVGTALENVPIRSDRAEGDEPPFAIATDGGWARARGAGALLPARVNLSVTAATDDQAAALWRLASALLHNWGPVTVDVDGAQVGVWKVFDETGPQRPVQEPDTGWWRVFGVFDLTMTDRAIG